VILSCSTGCLPYFENIDLFSSLNQVNAAVFELLVYRRYEDLNLIANLVKSSNAAFVSVHGAKAIGDMFFVENTQEIEEHKKTFEQNLQLAVDIGAKVIVLHSWNYTQMKLDPRKLVNNWNALRDQTHAAKLELSIELVPSPSPEFSTDIFAAIDTELDPSISLTLDTESAAWSGVIPEFFKRIDRIGNVHIKDFDRQPMRNGRRRYLKPGTGHIDFKTIFQKLRNSKYDRAIVLETPHRTIADLNETLMILHAMMNDS